MQGHCLETKSAGCNYIARDCILESMEGSGVMLETNRSTSFGKGAVAVSPPSSHTASLMLLQDSVLLNTSEETPWRWCPCPCLLGTSPGSILNQAGVPDRAFQLALFGRVGSTGAVPGRIALLVDVI